MIMDRNKIRKLTQAARVHNARVAGNTITEIIRDTGASERDVLDTLKVNNTPVVNNRPPRQTSRNRKAKQ